MQERRTVTGFLDKCGYGLAKTKDSGHLVVEKASESKRPRNLTVFILESTLKYIVARKGHVRRDRYRCGEDLLQALNVTTAYVLSVILIGVRHCRFPIFERGEFYETRV